MIERLRQSVSQFVESRGRDYEFPAGGRIELLTRSERELLDLLRECDLSIEKRIVLLAGDRNWNDCYSIVICGVRLAVLGARNMDANAYRTGVVALVAGSPKVDWRDVLGALAIFETCGKRLGINFQSAIEEVVRFSDETSLKSTIEEFFSRNDDMRGVDVMGFAQIGEGKDLTFRAKSMSLFDRGPRIPPSGASAEGRITEGWT